MENIKIASRQEIIEQAQRLAQTIAESEEVDFFKRAELQIKNNKRVQQLIDQIKRQQKHAVQFEHYEKGQALAGTKVKLEELHKELDAIPVINEFKQSQVEVNDLLQMVTSIISNHVTHQIIESTGGDLLRGETGGGPDRPSCPIR